MSKEVRAILSDRKATEKLYDVIWSEEPKGPTVIDVRGDERRYIVSRGEDGRLSIRSVTASEAPSVR